MKRVAFVNPPVWHYTGVGTLNFNANLGLLYLAAVLEKRGHEVKVFDAETMRWTQDMTMVALGQFAPDIVGITGTTLGWPSMKGLARTIKEQTKGKAGVMIGGPHVTYSPIQCMEESWANIAVAKEGEEIICDVVDGEFHEGAIEFKGYVDLEKLPWPARHLNVPQINTIYTGNAPRYAMPETCVNWQRGCPHNCSYCSHTVFGNRPIRRRKADDIVGELRELKEKWGIRTVFVYDDELIGVSEEQNRWLNGVLDAVIHADLGLLFKTQGRCSERLVNRDLLLKMRRAGFCCLMLGCESGSDKVLKAINKKTTVADIQHTVRTVNEANIDTFCFFMVGNLEETLEETRKTEALMRKLKPWMTFKQVTICTPWAGSRVYDMAKKEGWLLTEDPVHWLADRPAMSTPWMTPEEMIECRSKLMAI